MSGPEPPQYTKYRARPRLLRRAPRDWRERPDGQQPRAHDGPGVPRTRRRRLLPGGPITVGRVVKWLALALAGWLVLSIVLFLVSAQIEQGRVSDETSAALAGGGLPITSPTTILVLGSDQRPKGSKEPGASTTGPSRSDSILLLRVGGGENSRLSIARDTLVDVPGQGRSKINAAYAYGGAALAITTISDYLDTPINHVIEVSFDDFPDLVDAMGGIDYKGGCVVARVNGGYRNGGVTVRIRAGQEKHLNGKQALALARTRKNLCNAAEDDLSRARRQQQILSAVKGRLVSPGAFIRLPWVSWKAPQAIRSDMGGAQLLGLFGAVATSKSPPTRILGDVQADGSVGISEAEKQAEVRRFLKG